MAGKSTLDLAVTPFEPPDARVRADLEAEAGHVAAARGARNVRVSVDG
jgi:hypothetical protein